MVEKQKMSIEGKVVFMRGKVDKKGPWCGCCGDKNVSHAHIFNRHIELPGERSKVFAGGFPPVRRIQDFAQEFLSLVPNIEGKTVKTTIEVVPPPGLIGKYKVKPLPREFCVGCMLNGCYPWNTNPASRCSEMGGLCPALFEKVDDVERSCLTFKLVTEDTWKTHLQDDKVRASRSEKARMKARDGGVYSSERLPGDS